MLENAGVKDMLDFESRTSAEQALIRLPINEDMDGAREFLRMLADSISQAQRTALPALEPVNAGGATGTGQ